ncbi:hypothetical protein FIBSPDRAFT_483068 [Athelia psychrophila]|uniref:Uncharacterized protein n=1 Tax=Athelia psychrophila TaxID=1759441 RepID=A0A166L124_9AGAM|nr:hypothetical protein FIBSPDRAFT_483068 [Fibularhizoctonia sp. CBS 109695]
MIYALSSACSAWSFWAIQRATMGGGDAQGIVGDAEMTLATVQFERRNWKDGDEEKGDGRWGCPRFALCEGLRVLALLLSLLLLLLALVCMILENDFRFPHKRELGDQCSYASMSLGMHVPLQDRALTPAPPRLLKPASCSTASRLCSCALNLDKYPQESLQLRAICIFFTPALLESGSSAFLA